MLRTAIFALLLCGQVKDEPIRSDHFHVYSDDPMLGAEVSREAERYWHEIARDWAFGKEVKWGLPHVIYVTEEKVSHGNNKWVLISNVVTIGGPRDVMLKGMLPHEVCHSVMMITEGYRIPLWTMEGIAMLCERHGENNEQLIDFAGDDLLLDMFTARRYTPLFESRFYGNALSVTTWLVGIKGRKTYVDFARDGHLNGWEAAVTKWYGFKTIDDMQAAWRVWHKQHYGKPLRDRIK